MIKAILFDLDGTLTFMDQNEFMRNYIGLLVPRFAHLLPQDKLAKHLLRSTEVMIKEPKTGRTNLQNFFDDFSKATGLSYSVLWPIFEEYYLTDFPALRCLARPNSDGKKVVETALQQGYAVAVAANPVMPKIAITERIRWADLAPEQFTLVPAIEEFHFCKPQLGFFQEIATRLGLKADECLMVGNHPQEDMAARQIGMKTFFVGDSGSDGIADYAGSMTNLNELILRGNL